MPRALAERDPGQFGVEGIHGLAQVDALIDCTPHVGTQREQVVARLRVSPSLSLFGPFLDPVGRKPAWMLEVD